VTRGAEQGIGPRPAGADVAALQRRAAGGRRHAALTCTTDMRDHSSAGPNGSDGVRGEHDSATRR
jgi:hypothetical protein